MFQVYGFEHLLHLLNLVEIANKMACVKKVYLRTSWLNDRAQDAITLVKLLEKWKNVELHLFCSGIFVNSPARVSSFSSRGGSIKLIDQDNWDLQDTMEYRDVHPVLVDMGKRLKRRGCGITHEPEFMHRKEWPRDECEV